MSEHVEVLRDRVAKAIADAIGHGMAEKCYAQADAAIAALSVPAHGGEAQEDHRELLGRIVRMEWEAWAREQPNPKPSWLTPWNGLTEPEREVDRRIGERIYSMAIGVIHAPTTERAQGVAGGRFPAFLTMSQAWPQGYVFGWNDALKLAREEGFGPRLTDDELETFAALAAAPQAVGVASTLYVNGQPRFRTMQDGATLGEYLDQLAVGNLTPVDQMGLDNILHDIGVTATGLAGGDGVQAEVVAKVFRRGDEFVVDWLLEGGIHAVGEDGDAYLYVLDIPVPEDGHVELFTARERRQGDEGAKS